MVTCALCPEPSREGVLIFHNVRNHERVSLEIPLCEQCAARIEKHIKRAVPKRLLQVSDILGSAA